MRVFVTGASGWVGSAVTRDLIAAGHRVLGLVRSDAGARIVADAGGEVLHGSIEDVDALGRAAAACDGVVHTGFIHDFSNFAAACATDKAAIEALGTALAGTGRPLIVTGGMLGMRNEDETFESKPALAAVPRRSEPTGLAQVARGVRAMVVRLAPSIHGDGDRGFIAAIIHKARETGFVPYVGDGSNRWSAAHRLDAARIYRLALENGEAGARYHGVADEGVPVRQIAELIGRRLGVPAVSKTPEEVAALLGFIGHVLAMDVSSSNALTKQRLGWSPTQPGLIADLEAGHYFNSVAKPIG